MLNMVSVLLKKKGEQYSSTVFYRNMENFGRLPMSTVMDVGFFLLKQSVALGQSFQIYTLSRQLTQLRRASKPLVMPSAGT